MLPLPLLKLINATVAFSLLFQPVLAAVAPEAGRAAPGPRVGGETAPVAAAGQLLTATVPAPLLASDALPASTAPVVNQAQVEETLRTSPIMFIENDNPPTVSAQGKERSQKTFQVQGANGSMWLAPDAMWVTLLEPSAEVTMEGRLMRGPEELRQARAQEPVEGVNLKISFDGATPNPRIEGFDPLDTTVSYFIGSNPAEWRTDVPVWGGVRYTNLYPGIDLVVTSKDGAWDWKLEVKGNGDPVSQAGPLSDLFSFDSFLASPTPEPSPLENVSLRIEGAEGLDVLSTGKFALQPAVGITTNVGDYVLPLLDVVGAEPDPTVVADVAGEVVESPFAEAAAPKVMMSTSQAGAGDLLYSTFIGGSGYDEGTGLAVDASGAAYITGRTGTVSTNFPTTPGAYDTTYNGVWDIFVTKLNSSGSGLVYSTFLGGSGDDRGTNLAVDASGAAYVTGYTYSPAFPVTPGAYDTTYNDNYGTDVFVTKLNSSGSGLDYSTFLGGNDYEWGYGLAVDASGAAYVTGDTESTNFPTTSGAYDTTHYGSSDAFVTKLNSSGSDLLYSTFLGGSSYDKGRGLAVDASGAAYVTGQTNSTNFPTTPGAYNTTYNNNYGWNVFMTKLNSSGSGLVYSTFLGGNPCAVGPGLDVDTSGAAYVTGCTNSSAFPTTPGAYDTTYNGVWDVFVTKLNSSGSALVYSTFLGGSDADYSYDLAVDASGAAYVTGQTESTNFPTTLGAYDTTHNGVSDIFVTKLNLSSSDLDYSTFLGGSDYEWGDGLAVDVSGVAYITGQTESTNFPITPGAYDTTHNGGGDAFVAKLRIGAPTILYGATRRTGGGSDWPVDNYGKETQATVGNPINTASGNQTYETTDLRLPTPSGDITFSRSYSSFNAYYDSYQYEESEWQHEAGSLGPGWMHNYETHLKFPFGDDLSKIGLLTPGATYVIFEQDETDPNRYTAESEGIGGEIVRGEGDLEGTFVYTSPEGIEMVFYDETDPYLKGRLDHINFQLDGTIDLDYYEYDPLEFPNLYLLRTVSDSSGTHSMMFDYGTYQEGEYRPVARLTTLTLSDGRSVSFEHTPFTQVVSGQPSNYWNANLTGVTDVRQKEWTYLYASEATHPVDPDPALALNYAAYPHLRHFLVERRMPLMAGQSQGTAIIQYRYQAAPDAETGYVPAARAIGEIDGAGEETVTLGYDSLQTITGYGANLGSNQFAGPRVEQTYDGYGRLTQEQIIDQFGEPIQGEGWQTEYEYVLPIPGEPETVIYRPRRTTDPNGHQTFYHWVDDFLSLGATSNEAFTFYQFVSQEAGLHLPELIFYPYAAGGAPQRIQTRLVYNTVSVANPVGDYEPGMPANQIPARIPNPYDVNTTLPKRLLLAREDYDPATGQAKSITQYYYYDAGPRKGLVQCVDTPTPGGDTYYDYNNARLPVDIYQGSTCTASGGRIGGLLTHLTYDSLNRVSTTTGPDGTVTRYEYIGQSELVSVVTRNDNAGKGILAEDTNGDTWNIKTRSFYNTAGRLLATIENYHPTYGSGTLVSPDLDGDGSADSFYLDPDAPHINRVTVYHYDAAGRVDQVTANYDGSNLENAANYYKDGRYNFSTRTVYDGAGRAAAVIENYTPGDMGGVPARLLDLDGDGVAETGLAISPDAPDRNRVTLSRYNSLGRLVKVISPAWADASGVFVPYAPVDNADGQTLTYNRITAYEYDAAGNVKTTIANYKEGGSGSLLLSVSLDPGDVTTLHLSTDEPDVNLATCTEYDVLGRPVFSRAACVDGVGDYHTVNGNVYNRVTYTAYDALDRPIVVVDNYDGPTDPPMSGDITLTPTATRNHVTRIYYDGLGRTEWVVRNMTGSTGRSIEQVLPTATSAGASHNLITRTYYNEAGQPIAVVENYRSDDTNLEAGEITLWLEEGYNRVTRTFYGDDGLPSAVTGNFVGDITTATSPPAFVPGQPDRNLTTYTQDYDDLNRPVQVSINRWDDHITSLVRYDNLGRVDWSIFDLDGQPRTTHVDYANLGFSVTTEDPAGRVTLTTADVRGNPSTTVAPSGAGYSGLDLTVANDYDLFGRVTRSDDGENAPVDTTYDALGQAIKVSSADRVMSYAYNLLGQVVIARTEGTSDGACSATAYQVDNAGQLLRVVENYTNPGGCGVDEVELPRDVETEYSYDAMGNLTEVVLANDSAKKYEFDALGQTIFEVLDPDGKKLFTRYCYDAAGSVTRTIRGSGQASAAAVPCDTTEPAYLVTAYRYDALGRLIEIDYEQTQAGMAPAANVTFTYDSFGNRKTMTEHSNPEKVWTYTSTRGGLLESVNWQQGGTPGTPVNYTYDPAGNRTGLAAGTLLDTRYVLDAAGRLDCIDIDANGSCADADVDYGYNDASQVTQAALPSGVVSTYSYDPLGQLDAITHRLAGSPISSFTYTPDGLGNRTDAAEVLRNPAVQPGGFTPLGDQFSVISDQFNSIGQSSISGPAVQSSISNRQSSIEELLLALDTAWKGGDICAKDVYTGLLAQAKSAQQALGRDDEAAAGHLKALLVTVRKQAGECIQLGAAHELIYRAGTLLLGAAEPAPTDAGTNQSIVNQQSSMLLVVESTGDGADANPGDGFCDNGSGACTLRAAIQEANSAAGLDSITFDIPGTGPYTIQPASALPTISDPVVIDATTQPGYAGVPLVEIDGSQAGGGNGLMVTAGGSTVSGLVINRFSVAGINLSSGGNTIQGSFIGTDTTGTLDLGNGLSGVTLWQVSNNTVSGNVIAGNGTSEVWIFQGHSNLVQGNAIGTDMSGSLDIGDASHGVDIWVGSNNTIGGTGSAGNLIAYNSTDGVVITDLYGSGATGNAVRGNAIFANGGLGIDLSPGGVTPNDPGDADIGANNRQNYPVLSAATSDAGSTTVDGALSSTASTVFTLDFYASATCDASGYGEGQTYLGGGQAMTDASGNASFSITAPTASPDGWAITATATNPTGNTSEFSACVTVTATGGGAPPQSDAPIFNDIDLPHDPTLGPTWDGENLTAEQIDAYRAAFTLDGVSFVGLAGAEPLSAGARSWLAALRQGETQVDLPAPDPMTGNPDAVNGWLVQDNILLRPRPSDPGGIAGLFEIVSTRAQDIELAYLMTAPPVSGASGDLELILGLDTTLEVVARQEGVYLIDAGGNGIFIGQGTVTDANGNSIAVAVQSSIDNQQSSIILFIPEDWLAQAVYPILIDPPVTKHVHNTSAQSQASYAWRYQYDGLGRLTYACSKWDGSKCTGRKFTYQYDEAGNLERFSRWSGKKMESVRFVIDDPTNQVQCLDANKNGSCTDDILWVYDNLSNLTFDGVSTYTYDTANRLVRVVGPAGTTTYEYSGDGDRVAETHDGARTEFTLDVAAGLTNVLAETTNGETISYLYGLGLVAQSMNGVTEYNLTDGLGSVRQLADPGGSVLLSQTFDPYGSLYEQSRGEVLWDAASPFGWTGQQSDPSGLTYLRARYYSPGMGRFTQLDPFAGALAIPATMNPYGYAHSSPLMYTDPSGELVLLTALLVGALIGGALGFGITYGTELYAHRSIVEKEGFWEAQKYLDWGRIGTATAIGAVSGALGYGAGWAATAGMYEVTAGLWAANLAWDMGTDMGVYGDSFLDAYTANMAFAMFDLPGPGDEMLFKATAHGLADDAGEAGSAARRVIIVGESDEVVGESEAFEYARNLARAHSDWEVIGTRYGNGLNTQDLLDPPADIPNLTLYNNVDARYLGEGAIGEHGRIYDDIVFHGPERQAMMGVDGVKMSWQRSSGQLAEEVIQGADVVLRPGGSVRFTSGGGMPAKINLDYLVKQANWPYGYIGSKVPWDQGGDFAVKFVSRNTAGKQLTQFANQKGLFWYIFTLSQ